MIVCVCIQWPSELQGKEAVCDDGASTATEGRHYGEKYLAICGTNLNILI